LLCDSVTRGGWSNIFLNFKVQKALFPFFFGLNFFLGGGGCFMANYIAENALLKAGIRPVTQIFCNVWNLIVSTIFTKNTYWFLSKSNWINFIYAKYPYYCLFFQDVCSSQGFRPKIVSVCHVFHLYCMCYPPSHNFVTLVDCWGLSATSWKVAGSIPDGFIGIFHWHNPSGRTITLG